MIGTYSLFFVEGRTRPAPVEKGGAHEGNEQDGGGSTRPPHQRKKTIMKKKAIRLWVTALDKFQRWQDGLTTEEELCSALNREPRAASLVAGFGVVFNSAVDALVDAGATREALAEIGGETVRAEGMVNGRREVYHLPVPMLRLCADMYRGAATQARVGRTIVVDGTECHLYGDIDYILPFGARQGYHDLKTSSLSSYDHYATMWQQVVYPWADRCAAGDTFFYDVFTVTVDGDGTGMWRGKWAAIASAWTEQKAVAMLEEMLGGVVLPFITDHRDQLSTYIKDFTNL